MPATRDVHDTTLDRASPAHWLGALRIRGQVTLALGIALLLLLGVGGRLLLTLRETTRSLEWLASNRFPASQALLGYESAAVAMQGALNGLLNHQADGDDRKAAYAEVEDAQRRAEAARAAFEALPQDEDLLDPWRSASALWEDWKKGVAVVVDKQRQRDALLAQGPAGGPRVAELDREAAQAVAAVRGTRQRLTDAVGTLVDYTKVGADAEAEVANRRARVATWTMSGVVAAALAALALLALLIARNVKRQLDAIAAEAARVSAAVADGRLDVRGDPATVNAEFRPIVLGLNAAVEAFVAPVRTVAASMARVAEGDLPPPIDAPWKGELEALEHSVNGCVAAVGAVVSDVDALAHAALEGRLAERADAGRHRGHFRRIVERLDATLDAVTAPVEEASQVLEELARRDLLARVEGDYRGDHARVKAAVNATAEALHGALSQVAGAVAQVSVASSQIASSSQAVAQGASEQASSLEETTSALEEMAAQTRQTADNAAQADAMARSARGTAEEGGAAVAHMTGTMEKIRSAAEGTSQIIKEVNEIAFQTNLLALNAAVEAARAGDAGRGFAVVADEVRALALRSKQAASRTEELIRQSVLQATEGEATSREVAERFTRIAGAVGQVTALVAEIAAAAREQAQGLEHLNGAMSEMDKVTQQNAASSEESSSAAAELSGRAEELAGLVGGFRLGRLAAAGALDRLGAAPAGAGASGPATQARA